MNVIVIPSTVAVYDITSYSQWIGERNQETEKEDEREGMRIRERERKIIRKPYVFLLPYFFLVLENILLSSIILT